MTFLLAAGVACAPADRDAPARTTVMAGDTLVIRWRGEGVWGAGARLVPEATFGAADGNDTVTLGGIVALAEGRDGRIFATDGQRRAVRVFDSTLRPVAIWGRDGRGPGELGAPDGGLAVLRDGRVAVRDPGNARIQLFGPDGAPAGQWAVIEPGLRTRDNFGISGDTLLSRVVTDNSGPIESWTYGLARVSGDGRVIDTIAIPVGRLPRATLVARRGGNTAELPLPFAPVSHATWHPAGGFAIADGDRYAITWPGGDGPLRVERDVAAVDVTSAESTQERAYVTKGLRWLDPAWTWTGADIPGAKPLISGLFAGRDGSVWVLREGGAVERDDPEFEPGDPASVDRRLRSRLTFDAFAADGALLGTVDVPADLQLRPQPVLSNDGLVGIAIDSLGVPSIVRFRIRREGN
ncbi:MAG: hypothetical protein IT520_14000 [Burkholderiales bacterium]|nr:hypothetical protein [Burkholderiales bacterium]